MRSNGATGSLLKNQTSGDTLALIENHHQTIFQEAEALFAATLENRGLEQVGATLKFLRSYCHNHFQEEEALMAAAGFPLLSQHQESHQRLLAELEGYCGQLVREGVSQELVKSVNGFIGGWLFEHIYQDDELMMAYLKA